MSGAGGSSSPPENPARRRALARLLLALETAGAALLGAPMARMLFSPLAGRGPASDWLCLCVSTEVRSGAPMPVRYRRHGRDAYRESFQSGLVWLRRDGASLTALLAECTHLGCNVAWDGTRKVLACPCHGGVFSETGAVLEGPAPRPLASLEVKEEAGSIWIKLPQRN